MAEVDARTCHYYWRDCHCADALSLAYQMQRVVQPYRSLADGYFWSRPSRLSTLLKHLLNIEGSAAQMAVETTGAGRTIRTRPSPPRLQDSSSTSAKGWLSCSIANAFVVSHMRGASPQTVPICVSPADLSLLYIRALQKTCLIYPALQTAPVSCLTCRVLLYTAAPYLFLFSQAGCLALQTLPCLCLTCSAFAILLYTAAPLPCLTCRVLLYNKRLRRVSEGGSLQTAPLFCSHMRGAP